MSPIQFSALLVLVSTAARAAENPPPRTNRAPQNAPAAPAKTSALPPLPEGVQELKFADFFKMPVGPRGLEISEKLLALDGQRVRVLGYMVYEEVTKCAADGGKTKSGRPLAAWMECLTPGRFLFTASKQEVSFSHYGLCDDLPPQTLYITVPEKFGEPVPYTPGLMLLTGVLRVGNHDEPDGRTSIARLTLDPPPPLLPTAQKNTATNP